MPTLPKGKYYPAWQPPPETTRATGDQEFYNSWSWRKVSKLYRADNPLCENCYAKQRLTEAELVDHIIPMPTGQALDADNFMGLCHVCHNSKSSHEGRTGGPLIAHRDGLPVNRSDIFKFLK